MDIDRKLVTLRIIDDILPIENADAIECAVIGGWKVVVKKGSFKAGDAAVYMEIDSFLPEGNPAWQFLVDKQAREFNGVRGHRLRTIKLRGQISQGLILPIHELPEVQAAVGNHLDEEDFALDFSSMLGVTKYEAPLPAQLQGKAKGLFPSFIRRTDEPRIQNCFKKITERNLKSANKNQQPTYEISIKIDGSSMTVFRLNGELRVCSRNIELLIDEDNKENIFVKMALSIDDKIPEGFALQGEIWGESIQGNKEHIKGQCFSIFNIIDISSQNYLKPHDRRSMVKDLGLVHVPVIHESACAPIDFNEAQQIATGPSIYSHMREGVVFKCNEDPSFSFKIISNEWLLSER